LPVYGNQLGCQHCVGGCEGGVLGVGGRELGAEGRAGGLGCCEVVAEAGEFVVGGLI
jgi:hypothetical protein